MDCWELIPGQNFPSQIYGAITKARCAILVATPDASDSGWVQQELDLMVNRKNSGSGFFFIPVILGEFPDLPFVETIQAVDFGDSSPETYRCAFHRLLSGIEQKPPGADGRFSGDLRLPTAKIENARSLIEAEKSFLDEVFTKLDNGLPLIILAQGDTHTQLYGRALKERAQSLYGVDNVFHIFPPNSTRADSVAYFGRLAKQCQMSGSIRESWEWADALAEILDAKRDLFVLVTGFENGAEESRAELAGELRQLQEGCSALRTVMLGGERLAALKHAHGNMSLLNIAEEIMIPELKRRDLREIFGRLYPELSLTPSQLNEILTFTGGHPRLLHACLQGGANSSQSCQQMLENSPLPWQLFARFRAESDRDFLSQRLSKKMVGDYDPWPNDKLLRRLYWQNLITRNGAHFVWRCDFIRETGQRLFNKNNPV